MSSRFNGTTNQLHGTLPIVPVPNRFIGTIHSSGHTVKVVALATTYAGDVLYMSVVGYQNSAASILSTLISAKSIGFEPDGEIDYGGPVTLSRLKEDKYKQEVTRIPGTKEVNHIILAQGSVNIKQSLLTPLVMPESEGGSILLPDRYVLGNESVLWLDPEDTKDLTPIHDSKGNLRWYLDQEGNILLTEEYTPHLRSFLAQLQCLHVLFLQHPDYIEEWGNKLWFAGLKENLIREMPACGVRAWRVDGNVTRWNNLIGDGLRDGSLPWPQEGGIQITKKAFIPPMQRSDVEQLQREAMNDALSIFAGSR